MIKNPQKLKEFRDVARSRLNQEDRTVFTPSQIKQLMTDIKNNISLPKKVTAANLIEILESSNKLKRIELSFPSKKYTRYTWGEKSIYEILSSLDRNAYYSHLSALHFHKLLDQDIFDVYLNIEQSQKDIHGNTMKQENIDKAFSGHPRVTNNAIAYQQIRAFLINGMYTNKLGVINMIGPRKENILVTDIERTLIDIAVRPHYSGGVSNVLKAYEKGIKKASIEKMANMLKTINYSYPYHQSIGFYMEISGYPEASNIFREAFIIDYNFYLTYRMDKPEYSDKWRIFYPKNLLDK